ncbi:MAG: hypothetical protein JO339_40635 [Alphaproteobacteria bacterium]|nr:hypothetical protein [Alphaproteobacteria bacterium]
MRLMTKPPLIVFLGLVAAGCATGQGDSRTKPPASPTDKAATAVQNPIQDSDKNAYRWYAGPGADEVKFPPPNAEFPPMPGR